MVSLRFPDPVIKRQTPAFLDHDAAQGALLLKEALDGLFAEAARELEPAGPGANPGQGAALAAEPPREGLSVFFSVDRPQVPLDNNRAERLLRGPAIGRREIC